MAIAITMTIPTIEVAMDIKNALAQNPRKTLVELTNLELFDSPAQHANENENKMIAKIPNNVGLQSIQATPNITTSHTYRN